VVKAVAVSFSLPFSQTFLLSQTFVGAAKYLTPGDSPGAK
jgi:hypothetical protein